MRIDRFSSCLLLALASCEGVLIEDVVDQAGNSSARFTIRVTVDRTDKLLAALGALGTSGTIGHHAYSN